MTLQQYYASLGLADDAWHVGPEHPALEELGLAVLATTRRPRILELGVQAGGFAVPVILAAAGREGFSYTGVDNLEYTNAVPLRLVADYLALHGVHENVSFIQGDAGAVLRRAKPNAFDVVLLDHYKPKYPVDLLQVCKRELLAEDGAIILHDVLTHAASEWAVCARVCRAFGYEWTIDRAIPQGAAIVRRARSGHRRAIDAVMISLEVRTRWYLHAAILRSRRLAGRALRGMGLRHSGGHGPH